MKKILIPAVLLVFAVAFYFFYTQKKQTSPLPQSAAEQKEETTFAPVAFTEEEKKNTLASFDIVRIEKDGSAVFAGRAGDFPSLVLMDGSETLATLTPDENGEWVHIPDNPLKSGDHEFWLKTEDAPTKESAGIVFANVPERPEESMVVMISSANDADILQKPSESPEMRDSLTISLARYTNGVLNVKGKRAHNGSVLLYIGNKFIDSAENKPENVFELNRKISLDLNKPHLLRADETDERGKVVARIEVPFFTGKGVDSSVRIVKGDNLWTIARQVYGSGFDYITIYQANKNQIKNPDLIYPEQVFTLPKKAKN